MARRNVDERCSFCGKTRDKVGRLVAGPGVFICDRCVALCSEVINQHPPLKPNAGGKGSWVKTTSRPRGWFWRFLRTQRLQSES